MLIAIIPRAVPWARSFCPFRACGAYMRNLSILYNRREEKLTRRKEELTRRAERLIGEKRN